MPYEHQRAVGALIRRLRQQQGWSQRALADWVHMDQSAVSRVETGQRSVTAEELGRFADALHVSTDALVRGAPRASSRRPAHDDLAALRLDALMEARTDASLLADYQGDDVEEPLMMRMESSLDLSGSPSASLRARREALRQAFATEDDVTAEPATVPPALERGRLRLPDVVTTVVRDWFTLLRLETVQTPVAGRGREARSELPRPPSAAAMHQAGVPVRDVPYDRVARFWRSELLVDPDDGPLPDLVPLLEEGHGTQVIVARIGDPSGGRDCSDRPVAAAFTVHGVPFIFVNAAQPVALQRLTLAHAFAHLVLGHGDTVDGRLHWSRNAPLEAAANDFAEEFLAPVRAVRRWYERRARTHAPGVDDLLALGNAFGLTAWTALYRTRAALDPGPKHVQALRSELHRRERRLLARQAFLGGLRDTLSYLTPDATAHPGACGGPAVLHVPAVMRRRALAAVEHGRLSLEAAAAMLGRTPAALGAELALLGLE